jgi:hypothetical protein
MYESFVESAVLIGLMLLAIDCDLHRHLQRPFGTTASTPFDSQRSIVGPPALAIMVFYMYTTFAGSTLVIGLMLLSIQ